MLETSFIQFDHGYRCPACGLVHQMWLERTVVECQPRLFNTVGFCSGSAVLMETVWTGKRVDAVGRIGMDWMARKEAKVLDMLLGQG